MSRTSLFKLVYFTAFFLGLAVVAQAQPSQGYSHGGRLKEALGLSDAQTAQLLSIAQ